MLVAKGGERPVIHPLPVRVCPTGRTDRGRDQRAGQRPFAGEGSRLALRGKPCAVQAAPRQWVRAGRGSHAPKDVI